MARGRVILSLIQQAVELCGWSNHLHDYEYTHEYEYEYLLSYTIHIMSNMQSYYSYSTHLKIILLIL